MTLASRTRARSIASILAIAGVVAQFTVSGGAAFAFGEVGYIHTDGTVRKAQSDGTSAEADAAVICTTAAGVANGASGSFRLVGVTNGLSGGTAGSLAYVSATAGAITTTPPVTGFSKIIGRWLSATSLYFAPSPEVAPFAL